ncbi:MAG: hypothetical protein ACXVPU_02640 [Bacteroidia bacterium]
MAENKIYKEIIASIIIIAFIGIVFLLTFCIDFNSLGKTFYISIVSYLASWVLLAIINKYLKNKYLDKINQVVSFPLIVIYGILTVVLPFWALLMHLIFYFGIAYIIPVLLYGTLKHFNVIDFIKEPTAVYLKITASVFICVLLNPLMRRTVYIISPAHIKTSEKLRPYELDKLTDYLLSSNNVRFLVYTFYGISLLTLYCYNFQGLSLNKGEPLKASFETFIAFDASLILLKLLDFRPSELLTKIRKSISNKLTEEDKNSS